MDSLTIVLGIVITLAAAGFAALPFLRPEPAAPARPAGPPVGTERRRWERQKAEAYAAIKEAEFDHRTGKLSEADFGLLRDKYLAQASAAHAALETPSAATPRPGARAAAVAFCPDCGSRAASRARFCSGCGCEFGRRVA